MTPCAHCGGAGWFWWGGPGPGVWLACAACNDEERRPKPEGIDADVAKARNTLGPAR